MLCDSNSNEKCFLPLSFDQNNEQNLPVQETENLCMKPMETSSRSPPSLPELNIVASPNSQNQSTESPIAPSGTTNSPVEEESTKKILKCDYCDKTFTLANVLKVHQRIHTGEKPYVCEICGKAFNQSGSLNRHRNTHRYRDATDSNYLCRFCNAKFPHGSLLENHEKTAHHNRRSGRPRNLSSTDNNASSLDGKSNNLHSDNFKFNYPVYNLSNDIKCDAVTPTGNEDMEVKTDTSGITKDHSILGGSNEAGFICPYCQLNLTDIRDLGVHLSQHNLGVTLVSGSSGINSPTNPLISKNCQLFSPDSLMHQLANLSKKLKMPISSDFNPNMGISSVPNSSFLPISFDRLRSTEELSNINFPLANRILPNTNPSTLSDSYNLAAFVLATLSKDYFFKQRTVQQENSFPLSSPDFLKNPNYNQKSPMLGRLTNSNHLDFYNLFNLQKPLQNLLCNIDNNIIQNNIKPEIETNSCANLEKQENNYNVMSMANSRTNSSPSMFLPKSKEPVSVNGTKKNSVPRSSPASSGDTTQSSSNKTADLFFSRKSGSERRKCPDCDKQFTCESALRIHYRKHSGERPYACEYCSKTFSQNGTLKRHHLTCKNRPTALAGTKLKGLPTKVTVPKDPDSTQEVNSSTNGSTYTLTASPPCPFGSKSLANSQNPHLNFMMNNKVLVSKINETINKFDHFPNNLIFQTVSSYSTGNMSNNKSNKQRFAYNNNVETVEEPTDLTVNFTRHSDTVSQSNDGDVLLDIDNIDESKDTVNIDYVPTEKMDISDHHKISPISNFKSESDAVFRQLSSNIKTTEKTAISHFSTQEILSHLVKSGRLLMCRHCLIYFENDKTYTNHIQSHSEEKSNLECRDCKFVAKDEVAFKDHFNDICMMSENL